MNPLIKQKICCFTGHRVLPEERIPEIKLRLQEEIINHIGKGVLFYVAGGALGFDTIAAQTVLNLKETYPQIGLILALPCHEQTKYWKRNDIYVYEDILVQATKVVYTSIEYSHTCMWKRNRFMVDQSAFCIYYMSHKTAGTYYTVQYATQQGLNITNIA